MRSNSVIWDFFWKMSGRSETESNVLSLSLADWLQSWGYRFRFLGMLGSLEWWHCDRPNKASSLVTSSVLWPLVSHSQYSGVASASVLGGISSISFKILTAIFGIHVLSIHNTSGEYSQSINMWVYAPDMTPGNGHRTQNRASLCHSPGGWDYTSTAGAWLGLSCEESGETETKRCKYLHNRVFTPKMLALNSKSDQGLFWLELLLVMPINCAGQNVRFWGARMFYAGGNQ